MGGLSGGSRQRWVASGPATPHLHSPTHRMQGGATARWCIPAAADATKVAACTTAVGAANTPTVTFSCVAGGSEEACMDMVSKGTADLVNLGGERLPARLPACASGCLPAGHSVIACLPARRSLPGRAAGA